MVQHLASLHFDSPVYGHGAAEYQITLSHASPLVVSLTDLTDNTDVYVYDHRGKQVVISGVDKFQGVNTNTAAEFISYSEYAFPFAINNGLLPAGKYTLRLVGADSTKYTLIVSNVDRPVNVNVGKVKSFDYRGELKVNEVDTYTFDITKAEDYQVEVYAVDFVDMELTALGLGSVIKTEPSGDDPMIVAQAKTHLEPGRYQIKLKAPHKQTRYILSAYPVINQ